MDRDDERGHPPEKRYHTIKWSIIFEQTTRTLRVKLSLTSLLLKNRKFYNLNKNAFAMYVQLISFVILI